ncbi:MAG: hypothetical protein Q9181_005559 [Wetmoreana brouardii]
MVQSAQSSNVTNVSQNHRYNDPRVRQVADSCGYWRVPYTNGDHATEGIAMMMDVMEERWGIFSLGDDQNHGDIFLKGRLTDAEHFDLLQGIFPNTLADMGKPGPGICGHPPASQHAVKPARPPQASSRQAPQSMQSNYIAAPPQSHPLLYPPMGHTMDYAPRRAPPIQDLSHSQGTARPQLPRQHRQPVQQAHRPNHYQGRRAASSSDSSTSADSDSASSSAEGRSSKRGPKKTNPKGRSKGKPKQRARRGSEEVEAYSADERPKRRAPLRLGGRRRGRSDDEEVEAPARRPAHKEGAPPPKGQGRRNRGREPLDDDEEEPPLDPVLAALKEQNGYGNVKGRDGKSGWH